jgi:hypothetical protein
MNPEGPLFHKPLPVIAARNTLYAIIFLSLVGSVIGEFTTSQHNFSSVWGLLGTIFMLVFLIVITHQIGLGKIWARTLLLLMTILAVLLVPLVIRITLNQSLVLLFVVGLRDLLAIVVVFFLFQKSSSAWFKEVASAAHRG